MAKFKVGDRVKAALATVFLKPGETGTVVDDKGLGFVAVRLDESDMCAWMPLAALEPLTPAVPDGWTPASEPPDSDRNVRVILDDGRVWYAWYGCLKDFWHIYKSGASIKLITENPMVYYDNFRDAAPGEVIAWREIEPAAKPAAPVRYAVTYKGEGDSYDFDDENCYSTLESATQAAKRQSVDANKPAEIWKLVAIVNPPAEPEVIRMEE